MSAPTVLLIHGLGGTHRAFDRLIPLLAPHTHVIAVDLPAASTIETQASMLATGLNRPMTVVGHSRGALVATALAEARPDLVTSLVLICPPWAVTSRLAASGLAERAIANPLMGDLVWTLATPARQREALQRAFAADVPVPEQFRIDLRRTGRRRFTTDSRAIDTYLKITTLSARLRRLHAPIHLLFATSDARIADPGDEFGDISHVRVTRLPGAGHTPQWEAPDAVANLVVESLHQVGVMA